jgi:SAM-dependent methyltransferase
LLSQGEPGADRAFAEGETRVAGESGGGTPLKGEEIQMEAQEWNPGSLLELSGGYWRTCALHAAVKLDVFTKMGSEELTAGELASCVEASERGVSKLLNALTAMKLLVKKGERYANTPAALAFLSKDSPKYTGHMILHHHHLMASWSRLHEAVQSGAPLRSRSAHGDEKTRESFLMGMFNAAMQLAPRLAAVIDLSGRRRLLDLGGGPGTYAIHFCLKNPGLRATVYDLPTTRPFALRTIERFAVGDRVDFVGGDYLEEEVPKGFDVAWLSQILHAEGPEDARRVVDKAVSTLNPGGMILIHEFILNDTMDGPLFPALFSLNMLLGTDHGQSYSEGQIVKMLESAGAKEIRRTPVQTPNDSGIILGVVP